MVLKLYRTAPFLPLFGGFGEIKKGEEKRNGSGHGGGGGVGRRNVLGALWAAGKLVVYKAGGRKFQKFGKP